MTHVDSGIDYGDPRSAALGQQVRRAELGSVQPPLFFKFGTEGFGDGWSWQVEIGQMAGGHGHNIDRIFTLKTGNDVLEISPMRAWLEQTFHEHI